MSGYCDGGRSTSCVFQTLFLGKKLHKVVFDSRHLLLTSEESKNLTLHSKLSKIATLWGAQRT
jgi:hypothetical protein